MSVKTRGSNGKCKGAAEKERLDQQVDEATIKQTDSAEVVKMLDSIFLDSENVSLESVIAGKSKLLRRRQTIMQSLEKLRTESQQFNKNQQEILKSCNQKCEEVNTALHEKLTLSDDNFTTLKDALQVTSVKSRRAIYFITLWLVKRLDQKLDKLFSLENAPANTSGSANESMLWDDRIALSTYLELLDIALSIQSSACRNLVASVTVVSEYWFKRLNERFSKELAKKLDAIKYPFSTAMQPVPREYTTSPLPQELASLVNCVQLLLEFRPPPSWKAEDDNTVYTATFAAEISGESDKTSDFGELLISKLAAPLARRFRFHFYGKRPTNSPEHPEWYHSQILSWLESNGQFVRALFTDSLELEQDECKRRVDELCGKWAAVVVRLAMEKLSLDLPAILDSDTIFAHLIDETLLFRISLFSFLAKQNVSISKNVDPLGLLLSSAVFDRWLDVERRFALTRIDTFLSKPDALAISEKVITDLPNTKNIAIAPTCVVEFVSLVSGLLDRCAVIMLASSTVENETLPPFCAFLAMILSLVDGFRIRLLQLGRTWDVLSSRGLALLAAAGHLEDALTVDWIHRPVVVASQEIASSTNIKLKKSQPTSDSALSLLQQPKPVGERASSSTSTSDFTDEAALFSRAVRELADDVVGALEMELTKACVSAAEDHARGEQSVELPEEQSSHVVITVVHCAAIALHNLLDRLRLGLGGSSAVRRLVGSRLAARVDLVLFSQIFERLASRKAVLAQAIAKELNNFIRTRVTYLLARHLSQTAQPTPERLLPRLVDALNLLTVVQEPVACLLRSTLTSETTQDEIMSSLEEVGCRTFSKSAEGAKLALLVLNIRFGAAV